MPSTVRDIIQDREPPVTVDLTQAVDVAIDLMIEHDFSQLPVCDSLGKFAGMITSDSILKALKYTGLSLQELRVSQARVKTEPRRQDEDLFGILNYLRDDGVLLIVDEAGALSGIITDYDITEFFRQRVEDIMNAQDIEGYLRDYVHDTYADAAGTLDQGLLSAAIKEITPSDKELHKGFRLALEHYLKIEGSPESRVNDKHMEEAFSRFLVPERSAKSFDELTLYEFSEIFLKIYKSENNSQLPLNHKAVRKLLENARDTRNDLAHLRQISRNQSKQLRYCKEWFAQHQPTSQATLRTSDSIPELPNPRTSQPLQVTEGTSVYDVEPADVREVLHGEAPVDNRPATLFAYLRSVDLSLNRIQKSIAEIERIVQDKLPISAYQHRLWWANDPQNPLAQQWLEAGWSVSRVNTYDGEVAFERIKEEGKRYIEFYNSLLTELRRVAKFEVEDVSPNGSIGIIVGGFRYKNVHIAMLRLELPRHALFRMEVAIYTGDDSKNQKLYEALQSRRVQIEAQLENHLEWLEENTADRPTWTIALSFDGGITSTDEELRGWALKRINDFYRVFDAQLNEVASEVMK